MFSLSNTKPVSPILLAIAIAMMLGFFIEVVVIRMTVALGSEDRIELWTIAGFTFVAVTAVAAMSVFIDRKGR